ncbi:MAG TPA: HipA domain-containing protein [Saprospiraceae bacterium]|nr:HipA domain-containing protein [Saprospiraceae bacterium]HMQ81559.1 HipA domain-containing protein [Saprospiraceae bacterium]
MPKFQKRASYPLYEEKVHKLNGCHINLQNLPKLRRGYFYKEQIDPGGDAPKSFIRLYEYGECRRDAPKNWIPYIAKVGHKWYPLESITEYLMNQIGEVLGLNMAKSKLVLAGGQVRFLSRYFLDMKKGEQLTHGAQIYARHLDDEKFVEEANHRKRKDITPELFNFKFTEEAIRSIFPEQHKEILQDFVSMLIFDAIVGNNDRHFYNWGVITDLFGKTPPRFSPIYDTARGLFWNVTEAKIKGYEKSESKLEKYILSTKPRIGWEGNTGLDHFQLIEKLFFEDGRYCRSCERLVNKTALAHIIHLFDNTFIELMSSERLALIKRCIKLRMDKLQNIILS